MFKFVCPLFICFIAFLHFPTQAETLEFDFPDFQVSSVNYPEGPTGMTLFYFPNGASAAIDIRGGSVGTFFTPEKMHQGDARIDGVAFAGGGIVGFESFAGVVSTIYSKRHNKAFNQMPLISGGVIFDYGPRKNFLYPDKALGEKAFNNLKHNQFQVGAFGAGSSATCGKILGSFYPAGQGGAFGQWGETKIAVFTVVNAVGVILNDKGEVVTGQKVPQSMQAFLETVGEQFNAKGPVKPRVAENTTLTVVIINQKLAPRHLQQIGRSVHHALSQVIYPYATQLDGDLVYTISTGSVESDLYQPGTEIEADLNMKYIYLSTLAGDLAKKSVWSSVMGSGIKFG